MDWCCGEWEGQVCLHAFIFFYFFLPSLSRHALIADGNKPLFKCNIMTGLAKDPIFNMSKKELSFGIPVYYFLFFFLYTHQIKSIHCVIFFIFVSSNGFIIKAATCLIFFFYFHYLFIYFSLGCYLKFRHNYLNLLLYKCVVIC